MVKIKIEGHKEISMSPLAFGTAFSELELMEDPVQEDVDDCMPKNGMIVMDYDSNVYTVVNKTVSDDRIIVLLESDI